MMNVYNQEDFTFCQYRLENDLSEFESDRRSRYSSPQIDIDDYNDLDRKLNDLEALSRQAFSFHQNKQQNRLEKVSQTHTSVNCSLVCSKALPNFRLSLEKSQLERYNQFQDLTRPVRSKTQQQKVRNGESKKNQKQQKIQFVSYFSVPNRNLCYSLVNA